MIRVIEKYHNYERATYYIDPAKLDPNNYVDASIIKALKKKAKEVRVWVDAHDWETDSKFNGLEPEVSGKAIVKEGEIEDKLVWLTIDFDGW